MPRTMHYDRASAVARISEHMGEEVWVRYLDPRTCHLRKREIIAEWSVLMRVDAHGIRTEAGFFAFEGASMVPLHGRGGIISLHLTTDGSCIYANEAMERRVGLALLLHNADVGKLAMQETVLALLVRDNSDGNK